MSTLTDLQGSYFGLEIDDKKYGYYTACSGISVEFEVAKFKEVDGTNVLENKRPGRTKYQPIVLKRGFTDNKELYDWFNEVVSSAKPTPFKTGAIVVYSRDMVPMARFSIDRCWPSKLSVSDLRAGQDEVMVEELTIQHELLEWTK